MYWNKKHIPLEVRKSESLVAIGENALEVMVGYQLGGYNLWNGDTEARGYYLYCSPVEKKVNKLSDGREYTSVSQVLGKGSKILLKAVSRQSKKALEEALKIAEREESNLVQRVLDRYGLKLAQN